MSLFKIVNVKFHENGITLTFVYKWTKVAILFMLNSTILGFDIYSAIEKSWNAWTSVPSTTSITQQKLLAGLLAILKKFIWFVHKENNWFNSYFYKIVHSICFQCLLLFFLCRCSNDINFIKGSPRLIIVYWQISSVKFDCVIAIT